MAVRTGNSDRSRDRADRRRFDWLCQRGHARIGIIQRDPLVHISIRRCFIQSFANFGFECLAAGDLFRDRLCFGQGCDDDPFDMDTGRFGELLVFVDVVVGLDLLVGDRDTFGQKLELGELRFDLQVLKKLLAQSGLAQRLLERLDVAGVLNQLDVIELRIDFGIGGCDTLILCQPFDNQILHQLL